MSIRLYLRPDAGFEALRDELTARLERRSARGADHERKEAAAISSVLAAARPGGIIEVGALTPAGRLGGPVAQDALHRLLTSNVGQLVDPVPNGVLGALASGPVSIEALSYFVDFNSCAIALPAPGSSGRKVIEHYLNSTPAPPTTLFVELVRLSRFREFQPRWLGLKRGRPERVGDWYQRSREFTWLHYALHHLVKDLDIGRIAFTGFRVSGHATPQPRMIERHWYLNIGAAIVPARDQAVITDSKGKILSVEWAEIKLAGAAEARPGSTTEPRQAAAENSTAASAELLGGPPAPIERGTIKRKAVRLLEEHPELVKTNGLTAAARRIAEWIRPDIKPNTVERYIREQYWLMAAQMNVPHSPTGRRE